MDRAERLRRAEKLVSSGQLDAAAAEYESLVAEHPRDLATANLLGDLHVRAGHPERARPHFEHVADAYAREGFFARAAGFYKKLLKIDPGEAVVLAKLGEVTARQGLAVEATAHFRSLARLLQERGDAKGVAEVAARIEALERGRDSSAARSGADGPAAGPGEQVRGAESSPARLALARTYVAAGLTAEARPILEALHADNPGDVDAAALLADLLERAGDPRSSVACLERTVAAHRGPSPDRIAALRRLGDALERSGQRARAQSAWRDALALAPGDRELTERLARAATTGGGPFTR
jgi:tetratricopeptide (TPR) repeat protein